MVEESPEVKEVKGPKTKKAKKGKGKAVKEEEGEETKPIILVVTSFTYDQCQKIRALCMYWQGGKNHFCHLCLVKKAKCKTDRQPSKGPTIAAGWGLWWELQSELAPQLLCLELLQTLLIEVQQLWCDHAHTQEVLRDVHPDIQEFQNSVLFLWQDRDHLAECQAASDMYLNHL
ncbi:hypothetical protein BV20DRAFT_1050625 [Pilatotrama ljubarskyi]|nr:hypothetical protein BV20DRAFT_1050625 [Pilatotrama ljubarskyi]